MKPCYLRKCEPEEVDEVISKGLDIICNNPYSISTFKNIDKYHIKSFIKDVVKGKYEEYWFTVIADLYDEHIVGACLFSWGYTWYNPNLAVANEECTVSFEKGYGVTRKIAEYLESLLDNGFGIVQASSANDCVAKLIENTYNKYGYKQYKSFYKTK